MTKKILIKGAGEQASAVAHRLFKCGYHVVMTEIEKPTAVRRRVSFSTAIYEKEIVVEDVLGVLIETPTPNPKKQVSVIVDPEGKAAGIFKPDIIIDARIMKKNLDNKISDAGLVIGLGPGLEAGKDVHVVIETNRGHDLGRVITEGFAAPDTKVPGSIGGITKERVLRAPCDGLFETGVDIGDLVQKGDVVAMVQGQSIQAEIAGVIRGLLPSGLNVVGNQKLGDIDPRGEVRFCETISDKARCISGSVLEVVFTRFAGS